MKRQPEAYTFFWDCWGVGSKQLLGLTPTLDENTFDHISQARRGRSVWLLCEDTKKQIRFVLYVERFDKSLKGVEDSSVRGAIGLMESADYEADNIFFLEETFMFLAETAVKEWNANWWLWYSKLAGQERYIPWAKQIFGDATEITQETVAVGTEKQKQLQYKVFVDFKKYVAASG